MSGDKTPCARIRRFCSECMGGHRPAVAGCDAEPCPLHAYRNCRDTDPRILIRAIRRFCMQCTGKHRGEIRSCEARRICPLWPYRLGASPQTVSRRMDRRRRPKLPGL